MDELNRENIDSFQILVKYRDQNHLHGTGIMIRGAWGIPQEREEKLRLLGMPVPEPVNGHFMVDTGADHVTIDDEVAASLKLKATGQMPGVPGLGGKHNLDIIPASLIVYADPIVSGKIVQSDKRVGVRVGIEAWEMKNLQRHYAELNLQSPYKESLKVIGIIGRVFLQFCLLQVDGLKGEVGIVIDKSCMGAR